MGQRRRSAPTAIRLVALERLAPRQSLRALTRPDANLTDAVIVLFRAAMLDALTDDQKRSILTNSGEWEECRQQTPEHEAVLYPPLVWSAEDLAQLATSAHGVETRRTARIQEERSRWSE
jgi:hypothetical protein